MKITEITTRLMALDMASLYGDAPPPQGESTTWQIPLITVKTDAGVEGHITGYDTSGGGPMIATLIRDQYAPVFIGQDPLYSENLWHQCKWLNRHLRNARDATSGLLDACLWDIRGKLANLPLGVLLGLQRNKVPCYSTGAPSMITTVEATVAEALRVKKAGYQGFKLQTWDGPALDIPRLRAAREAVGPDFPLMVDSSGIYTYAEAIAVGKVLDELDYRWFEEPVHDSQIDVLRRLSQQIRTPILAAETNTVHEIPEYIRDGAVDMIRGDAYIKGGVTGLRKALAACELFGYELEIHTAATPLMDVANLHVACSTKISHFVEHHHAVFRFGLKGDPLAIDAQGFQHMPTGPGLGVEIDWDWVENHTLSVT